MTTTADHDRMMEQMLADQAEPLLPELAACVDDSNATGFRFVKHPLVVEVLVSPGQHNRTFRARQEELAEAVAAQDWHKAVFIHARPYRTDALIEYAVGRDDYGDPLPLAAVDQDIRDLAADVWVDSENLQQYEDEWAAMLTGDGLVLGDGDERAEFDALPDPLTVYRGDCDDGGWSWSLSRKTAEFFATRFDMVPLVTGTVAKADVVGYLSRRGESEVLIPEWLAMSSRPC